ncbi:hypothetical protein V8C86DRAFT_2559002 [Haematococcus lacustris]
MLSLKAMIGWGSYPDQGAGAGLGLVTARPSCQAQLLQLVGSIVLQRVVGWPQPLQVLHLCCHGDGAENMSVCRCKPALCLLLAAQALAASEGKVLQVDILRAQQAMTVSLTPQKWEGRGLLGCHFKLLRMGDV